MEKDLFGGQILTIKGAAKKRPKNLFTDYDEFVDKFDAPKTTDDCYTPPDVYAAVVNYVAKHSDLTGRPVVRPFWPGGDYEHAEYPEGCVVIDNPPFSIISKVARFYISKKIGFFLFAPHLTLFGADLDCTHVVVGGNIIYENGANVKTSFLSNLFGDVRILGDPELLQAFKEIQERHKVRLPVYKYPAHIATVSAVQAIVERGVAVKIRASHTKHIRALAAQKTHGKAIFGSGFLLSEKAAAEKAAAEKAAAEKAAAEKAVQQDVIIWPLSPKELETIRRLGSVSNNNPPTP